MGLDFQLQNERQNKYNCQQEGDPLINWVSFWKIKGTNGTFYGFFIHIHGAGGTFF
ncbi:hypothetical protein P872_05120 [Rhodonellum psychrophilum GCM71 = DSM 17998]|uniref:Uncharacterized protein n=1 Tax=Rhodonellum psychrophilum GCM71 = DSM 17998 TaxID=1123057 RepID=U5C476_9BACT|nr:hypothetical protein P872_05120 [Rhodonellum psychrophilum GCM71 = DSM 17998]